MLVRLLNVQCFVEGIVVNQWLIEFKNLDYRISSPLLKLQTKCNKLADSLSQILNFYVLFCRVTCKILDVF